MNSLRKILSWPFVPGICHRPVEYNTRIWAYRSVDSLWLINLNLLYASKTKISMNQCNNTMNWLPSACHQIFSKGWYSIYLDASSLLNYPSKLHSNQPHISVGSKPHFSKTILCHSYQRLYLFDAFTLEYLFPVSILFSIFIVSHRFGSHMLEFIDSTLSLCILFDGISDDQVIEVLVVWCRSWFPWCWRDNLNKKIRGKAFSKRMLMIVP